jgi:hypothetical protein
VSVRTIALGTPAGTGSLYFGYGFGRGLPAGRVLRAVLGPAFDGRDLGLKAILGSFHQVDPTLSWYDNDGTPDKTRPSVLGRSLRSSRRVEGYDISLYPQLLAIQPGHSLRLVLSTQPTAAD